MKSLFTVLFLLIGFRGYPQKPAIGTEDFEKWSFVIQPPKISDDGEVAAYVVYNKPVKGQTLILQGINRPWRKGLVNPHDFQFVSGSKKAVCIFPNGQLCIISLFTSQTSIIDSVLKYSLFKRGIEDWIIYTECVEGKKNVVLKNLRNERSINCYNADEYWIDKNGSNVIVRSQTENGANALMIIDWKRNEAISIYKGDKPEDLVWNGLGNQFVFVTNNGLGAGNVQKKMWYFVKDVTWEGRELKPKLMKEEEETYLLKFTGFNAESNAIFCLLGHKVNAVGNKGNDEGITIWSYADQVLRSQSVNNGGKKSTCLGVFNIATNTITQLTNQGEKIIYSPWNPLEEDTIQLLESPVAHKGEWNWNVNAIPSRRLLNMRNGDKTEIGQPFDRNAASFVLSPSGRFLVYYDAISRSYLSYNIFTKARKSITLNVRGDWTTFDDDDIPFANYMNFPIAGFSSDGSKVFLYDQHDIFEASLNGDSAVNLTGGFGKKNNIVFRFAFLPGNRNFKKVVLTAFNRDTKQDGFFELDINKPGGLKKLTMQDAIFTGPEESKYCSRIMPVKARNAEAYLVQRMDAGHAPNIFFTKDFVKFQQISYVRPELSYNWLTTELIEFESLDGLKLQGVLYKPENFDSTKKYPIIFNYYEKISETRNLFINPEVCYGPMNIPFFVSNGYLVFTPDIRFVIGHPGRSAYNAIMGATNKIVQLPYVDSSKMGLQGHSFGGFQTNYVITHTGRFAAACSAAGFTNFVSAYGSIIGAGYSRQGQYELYRDRIGASLWKRTDLYLENSPVLKADFVNTPLLLMHNADDGDVPVSQGIEFFTGLRRLGKVTYLLQYKDQGHTVDGAAAMDYTKRMFEFFNYYLRDAKLPSWMTSGRTTPFRADSEDKLELSTPR